MVQIGTQWFVIAMLIVSLIFIGFSAANIYYFNRIKSGGSISHSDLNSSVIFNSILLAMALAVLIWTVWRLAFSKQFRAQAIDTARQHISNPAGFGDNFGRQLMNETGFAHPNVPLAPTSPFANNLNTPPPPLFEKLNATPQIPRSIPRPSTQRRLSSAK